MSAAQPGMVMSESLQGRIVIAAAIGGIPVFTVCIFLPLILFAGNSSEFAISYFDFLAAVLPTVIILLGVFGSLGALLAGRSHRRYIAILAALGILTWLQGNILVWDYGVLDGRKIDWLAGAWRGVLDIAVWCALLGAAVARFERFGKALACASVAAFGIQSLVAATLAVNQAQALRAPSEIELDIASGRAIPRFSRDRNVVHIVMDGFQSDLFDAIIDDPANADVKAQLRGFTVFRDNLGAFPFTQMSVPAYLSGRIYRNENPVDDFVADVMQGDNILNVAFDAGYEVDIAAPIPLKHVYGLGKHTHAYGISADENATREHYVRADLAKLLDLSLFRVVPHFAKSLVYRDHAWLLQPAMHRRGSNAVQYFADLLFLSHLAETMTVDRDAPVYKMIHVMLAHQPTVGNENCVYDGVRATNRANVTLQARCGLIYVTAVLQRMRELGIYDSSLIVLMGDHGAWLPVEDFRNEQQGPNAVTAMGVAMAKPVLAIKPPGASGDMQVSDAPTSVVDVPATISNLAGLEADFHGLPVFAVPLDPTRTRRHLFYRYGSNPAAAGYLHPMTEYRVEGSTVDANAWHFVTRHVAKMQNGD